ncbi:MAG: hypothetical protein AAF637_12510 [Pseudomonadota bacterium]
MNRPWPKIAVLFVFAGLLGCQPLPPTYTVERTRSYQQSEADVWDKIQQFLQANNITVRRSDRQQGTIDADRANYQDAGWADCPLGIGRDRDGNRPRRVRQRMDRSLTLKVALSQANGITMVTLDARFTERQIHPWRNLPFRTGCVSTGVLEKSLLDSI